MRERVDCVLHHPRKCIVLSVITLLLNIFRIVEAQPVIKFSDVARDMNARGYVNNGVSCFGHGAAMADVNGDSLPDILVSNAVRHADWIAGGLPEVLHISQPGGPYTNEAQERGAADPYGWTGSHGICFFDYNNDGRYDIFNATTDDTNRLYRNIGNGYYKDVTKAAQIPAFGYGTRGVVAVDVNNDGFLDLYGVNWGPVETPDGGLQPTPEQPNEFYLNNGDGTFTWDDQRGLTPKNPSFVGTQGVVAVDVDNDGDMDIFVCHRNYSYQGTDANGDPIVGPDWSRRAYNQLFINDGTGHFAEEAVKRGIYDASNDCNGTTFADYDNDGDLDAFVVPKDEADENGGKHIRIFRNNGAGYFEKIPKSVSQIQQWGFSALLLDVDNDGDLDLYTMRTRVKNNMLYVNDGSGKFTEQPGTGLEKYCYDPRGASVGDIDNDGKLDIYFVDANKDKDPRFTNYLFHNDTQSDNHWLKVVGRGPKGDMGGFGSKIWIFDQGHLDDMAYLVGHKQVMNAYGYLCQDDPVQHFGLGQRDTVDVRIMLLDSTVLTAQNVPANRRIFFSKPQNIAQYDGDRQKGKAGQELAKPLTVMVTDAFGNPIVGVSITFAIAQGDGQLLGNQPVYTDAQGLARTRYIMGTQPAEQEIIASSPLIPDAVARFTVLLGSEVVTMQKTAGDRQTGVANFVLPLSVQIRVLDAIGQPVNGSSIVFRIVAGDGKVEGTDSTTVPSDENGFAAAMWRLGKTAGLQKVRAYVVDQPEIFMDFIATATHSIPITFSWLGETEYAGIVGHSVSDSLIAAVADSFGNPVDSVAVSFTITAGGGTVDGSASAHILTDSTGRARAEWVFGKVAGLNNNVLLVEASGLAGSPVQVKATGLADRPFRIDVISGEYQSGCPGNVLVNPFVVAIADTFNNAIVEHPVTFAVTQGDANFSGQANVRVVTDTTGLARAVLTLGAQAGNVEVSASSFYQQQPLVNSPISFHVSEPCSQLDLQQSTVTATSPVVANGRNRSEIRVIAKDTFANSMAGVLVHLQATGDANTLFQPAEPTNSTGLAIGYLSSAKAENKQVTVQLIMRDTNQVVLPVQFVPANPAQLIKVSGDRQSAPVDSELDSVRVALVDSFANPILQAELSANIRNPLGETEPLPGKSTDQLGRAVFPWHLGARAGRYTMTITHAQILPAIFTAEAHAGAPNSIDKISGDGQKATASAVLPLPLQVWVCDKFSNPVFDLQVAFNIAAGSGSIISANPATTDSTGIASAVWQLGSSGAQTVQAMVVGHDSLQILFSAELTENQVPVISCVSDTNISEMHLLSFVVNAVDPEASPVHVEATKLPSGAVFEESTRVFAWIPNFDQAGVHQATFLATDDLGSVASAIVTIRVFNVNRSPRILSYQPTDSILTVNYNQPVYFRVEAKDDDGDTLKYRWYFNGALLTEVTENSFAVLPLSVFPQTSTVEVRISDGQVSLTKSWTLNLVPSGVAERNLPRDFSLGQNYPNPFNPSTSVSWQVPHPALVKVTLFNASGQLVRTLANGFYNAGEHSMVWDAKDDAGRAVPSGIYYYKMQAEGFHQTKKLLLLK